MLAVSWGMWGVAAGMSATLSTEMLMALAEHGSTTASLRILFFAAERANRQGLAVFDPQELADLMADVVTGRRMPSSSVHNYLRMGVRVGHFREGSTTTAVQIDTAKVQPEGFPEVGARYGDLTLVRCVSGDAWLCECDCRSRRVYSLPYLVSGITRDCGQHRPTA